MNQINLVAALLVITVGADFVTRNVIEKKKATMFGSFEKFYV